MSEIPTDPANAIELEIHQRTVKLQREAMSEQKLREALQEYDTAFSDFNPENKKSRERMRRAVVKAREALAQPTSDELRALPSGYVQVPEGWKLVPIEPTEEMLKAFRNASENSDHPSYRPPYPAHRAGYDALLAATPTPSDSKPGEGT